ncbi:MAG: hypothetical protein HY461_03280 [Parcubacteria group bacterium]|nr:hypothetical protein [Parcubacteria group bacterium]
MDELVLIRLKRAMRADLEHIGRFDLPDLLSQDHRRGDVTLVDAVELISTIPRRQESLIKDCLGKLSWYDVDHATACAIVNQPRLFAFVSECDRRRIRDMLVESGDLTQVGVAWITMVGGHLNDMLAANKLIAAAIETHPLECIQELGDETVRRADEFLLGRVRAGQGAVNGTSLQSREFMGACHLLGLPSLSPLQKAQLASEMLIMLVGSQSRRSREIGADEWTRPIHQRMQTLEHLLAIIIDQMTPENAGVVLRWAMGRRRHHHWLWNRLMDQVKQRHHWRMGTYQDLGDLGCGICYNMGSREIIVLPSEGCEERFGWLKVGCTVMTAPTHVHGKPVERTEKRTVYRGDLHPLMPPTEAMIAAAS